MKVGHRFIKQKVANNYFRFKQFTVFHDRCAMKVGTDGVLLGAWASADHCKRILDVGTGSGLIALQLAQRCSAAHITAVEIDAQAAAQATENTNASPWSERLEVLHTDFLQYQPEETFDLIVSNPPYFQDALKCPDAQRNTARHTDTLSFEAFFRQSVKMLSADGRIALIIPTEAEESLLNAATLSSLFPHRRLAVFTKPGKPCRRLLIEFGLREQTCRQEELCIEHEHHHYTPEYISLTKDFYLAL